MSVSHATDKGLVAPRIQGLSRLPNAPKKETVHWAALRKDAAPFLRNEPVAYTIRLLGMLTFPVGVIFLKIAGSHFCHFNMPLNTLCHEDS